MQADKTQLFEQHRRTLEGLAYRMLGTLAEARDAVQETYLKWHEVDASSLHSPRAWLVTVCSRIALNQLQSARKQREIYIGEWLPEPFPDEPDLTCGDPATQIERDDSVSVALLLALETLSPSERAAFLLHDIFDLGFDEVALALGKSSASCRQLATRARKRIQESRPRFVTTPQEHRQLLHGFMHAARHHDVAALVSLLAEGVELYSDGGGQAQALPEVLQGAHNVARFFVEIYSGYDQKGITIRTESQRFNGSLGVLIYENEQLATVLTVEAHRGCIQRIYAVRNPCKFSGFSH